MSESCGTLIEYLLLLRNKNYNMISDFVPLSVLSGDRFVQPWLGISGEGAGETTLVGTHLCAHH